MPPDSRAPFLSRYPTAWLISATLALLAGQALAATPLRPSVYFLILLAVPLLLCFVRRWRAWAIFCLLAGILFAGGYRRHLELIEPEFPANHIRSIMESGRQLYLEGWLAA